MDNWYDLQNNDMNAFIKAYRESLQAQRDSSIKQLNQARKNYHSSIMGGANRRGMLYSNFPQRDKLIYDTSVYDPAFTKVNTTYQTGLDTLRNNAISLWNKIKSYQEAIDDLNSSNTGTTTDTDTDTESKKKNSSTDDKDNENSNRTSRNSDEIGNYGAGGAGW